MQNTKRNTTVALVFLRKATPMVNKNGGRNGEDPWHFERVQHLLVNPFIFDGARALHAAEICDFSMVSYV